MKELCIKAYCFTVIAVIYILYALISVFVVLLAGTFVTGFMIMAAPLVFLTIVAYIVKCTFASACETYFQYRERVINLSKRGEL